MNAEEIKSQFSTLAHDNIMTDSVAGQVGLRDLYYASEKYGSVDAESFKSAMIRYFARCGYNSKVSAEKLAAFEVKYIHSDDFGRKDTLGFSD